jgi:DNA-binding NtrC family response regulator
MNVATAMRICDNEFEGFRSEIVGESAPIRQLFDTLERVAPLMSTVLIQGETGTGKELVARTIHQNSPRRGFPFVAFNAAAIPEGLVEAELFGHVKGSFTGAISDRIGRFEMAHRGTLFIDEVSTMPAPLQAKLLRALQEREVERVGASRSIKIDTRVIAASNVDLLSLVKKGEFREDLYYRLNVVRVKLPALRERRLDIPVLVRHFLSQSFARNEVPARPMSAEALEKLVGYDWPGNIRQLENAVEHAVVMSGRAPEIQAGMLPDELLNQTSMRMSAMTVPAEGLNFASFITEVERDVILQCLKRTGGNKRQAAILLQLSRTTLIDKLHRLGIVSVPAA